MIQLAFPVLGALALYLAVVPALTLAVKAALVLVRRRARAPWAFGSAAVWLALAAPVAGTAAWSVSAGLHLVEDKSHAACLVGHPGLAWCLDAALFALVIAAAVAGVLFLRRRREPELRSLGRDAPAAARVQALCAGAPDLAPFAARVQVVVGADVGVRAVGAFRPAIQVSEAALARLDDEALVAALAHEAQHLRDHDPLRYFLARALLVLDPLGFVLRPELARWRLAREVSCDREAVRRGADPLALAHALVVCARRRPAPPVPVAGLSEEAAWLSVRTNLLLGYVDARPGPAAAGPGAAVGLALAGALLLWLPHPMGGWPVDLLHHGIEAALALTGL